MSIVRFKQTDIRMPSFVDVNSVIGISHEVDGTKRTANIYLIGGGVLKAHYDENCLNNMRDICDDIIKEKERVENIKETERVNSANTKKKHR